MLSLSWKWGLLIRTIWHLWWNTDGLYRFITCWHHCTEWGRWMKISWCGHCTIWDAVLYQTCFSSWTRPLCIYIVCIIIYYCDMPTPFILCSVLNWRTPSHYLFIRQQNKLFDCVHFSLQACITHILCACKMCAQLRDAHLRAGFIILSVLSNALWSPIIIWHHPTCIDLLLKTLKTADNRSLT